MEQKHNQILQEYILIYNSILKMIKGCWYKYVIWRVEGGGLVP